MRLYSHLIASIIIASSLALPDPNLANLPARRLNCAVYELNTGMPPLRLLEASPHDAVPIVHLNLHKVARIMAPATSINRSIYNRDLPKRLWVDVDVPTLNGIRASITPADDQGEKFLLKIDHASPSRVTSSEYYEISDAHEVQRLRKIFEAHAYFEEDGIIPGQGTHAAYDPVRGGVFYDLTGKPRGLSAENLTEMTRDHSKLNAFAARLGIDADHFPNYETINERLDQFDRDIAAALAAGRLPTEHGQDYQTSARLSPEYGPANTSFQALGYPLQKGKRLIPISVSGQNVAHDIYDHALIEIFMPKRWHDLDQYWYEIFRTLEGLSVTQKIEDLQRTFITAAKNRSDFREGYTQHLSQVLFSGDPIFDVTRLNSEMRRQAQNFRYAQDFVFHTSQRAFLDSFADQIRRQRPTHPQISSGEFDSALRAIETLRTRASAVPLDSEMDEILQETYNRFLFMMSVDDPVKADRYRRINRRE